MADLSVIESDALPPLTRVLGWTGEESLSTLCLIQGYVLIHDHATRTLDLDALADGDILAPVCSAGACALPNE